MALASAAPECSSRGHVFSFGDVVAATMPAKSRLIASTLGFTIMLLPLVVWLQRQWHGNTLH
jgi:hypothetical protein